MYTRLNLVRVSSSRPDACASVAVVAAGVRNEGSFRLVGGGGEGVTVGARGRGTEAGLAATGFELDPGSSSLSLSPSLSESEEDEELSESESESEVVAFALPFRLALALTLDDPELELEDEDDEEEEEEAEEESDSSASTSILLPAPPAAGAGAPLSLSLSLPEDELAEYDAALLLLLRALGLTCFADVACVGAILTSSGYAMQSRSVLVTLVSWQEICTQDRRVTDSKRLVGNFRIQNSGLPPLDGGAESNTAEWHPPVSQ